MFGCLALVFSQFSLLGKFSIIIRRPKSLRCYVLQLHRQVRIYAISQPRGIVLIEPMSNDKYLGQTGAKPECQSRHRICWKSKISTPFDIKTTIHESMNIRPLVKVYSLPSSDEQNSNSYSDEPQMTLYHCVQHSIS